MPKKTFSGQKECTLDDTNCMACFSIPRRVHMFRTCDIPFALFQAKKFAATPKAPPVRGLFLLHYTVGSDSHVHVHGANLGVRADAYMSVGGFPSIALAEDHALWRALTAGGFRCRSSVALSVSTSGRLVGRARGGFADNLRALTDGDLTRDGGACA